MASTQGTYSCDICIESHVTAIVRCPDCEEFLCSDCSRHHFRSKISKDHAVITVEDYSSLPKSVLALKISCNDHNEKYEFYCQFHRHPCCIKCINETHVDCRNLLPLHDVIKGSKTQTALDNIEQEANNLRANLNELYESCSLNFKNLDKQKEACLAEVVQTRQLINHRLDKLELNLKNEIELKYDDLKSKTTQLLAELTIERENVKSISIDLEIIRHKATAFQIFMFTGETENAIDEKIKYLRKLHETGSLDEIRLQLDINPELLSVMKNSFSFGTMSFQYNPISLDILPLQIEHEHTCNHSSHHVEKIQLIPKMKIELPKGGNVTGITGCEILNNGELLFVDFDNQRLLSTDKQNHAREVMRLTGSPRDIAIIDGNTIAITIRDEKNVILVDLKTKKVVSKIDVTSQCYGIDRVEDKLVVRLNHIGQFLVLDLKGKILSRLHISGYYIQDVALFDGKIFCTNCEDHKVFCYDMNGDLLWQYSDDLLRNPFGISEDKSGNIYVAGRQSNNVIVISPDGHRNKVLLTEKHGVREPYALHVNKTTSELLVCNEFGGQAFLYDICSS